MTSRAPTKFTDACAAHPCPVCEGTSGGCSIGADGLFLCRKREGPQVGFVCLGGAKADNQWTQFRREDDSASDGRGNFNGHGRVNGNGNGNGSGPHKQSSTPPTKPATDWLARAHDLARRLTPERRTKLAEELHLPESCFAALPLLGYYGNDIGGCWTFPEVDGKGRVVGINRRYRSGGKKAMEGGNRGLTVPAEWSEWDGPLLLPEGASNVLALTALGLAAVGRPNNTGGVEQLVELLATVPKERPIIVVADFDPKDSGDWPGLNGAKGVAEALAARLGRRMGWALPPDCTKDVRKWTANEKLPQGGGDEWSDAGEKLLKKLLTKARYVEPNQRAAGFRWEPIDSAAFAALDAAPQWLVKRLLVSRQPAVIGGPKKVLKTSLLVDLAISLASGEPFLGTFDVYRPQRIALLSGESGEWTLRETALRVCAAKGIDLADLGSSLLWQCALPQLAIAEQLGALKRGLAQQQVDVVIADPLYLTLSGGGGQQGARAENLYEMGPLLLGITQSCLEAGATLVLAHHTKKGSRPGEPLDLDDLAYAGIAEFARQWLLVSRREAYEAGTGQHKLVVSAGGSCGQGGLWAVDVDEGQLADDFTGRRWQVEVRAWTEQRAAERSDKAVTKERMRQEQDNDDDKTLLLAVERLQALTPDVPPTVRSLRTETRLSEERIDRACNRLVETGKAELTTIEAPMPKGGTRKNVPALRLLRMPEDGQMF